MTIRTFIALEIPDDALSQLLSFRDEKLGSIGNIRWESKNKLHLTLKFLGETQSESIVEYSNAITKIIVKHKSFDLSFSEFGVFKKGNEPKILWVGLKKNENLVKLVNDIELKFSEFGFERERREYKAHITLLRFRGYEGAEKILSLTKVNLPAIKFISNTVNFYESKLLPSGSVYKSLKSFYLEK
jgi:RNA 2',3'-cyclic 3'-phosphodiesterase